MPVMIRFLPCSTHLHLASSSDEELSNMIKFQNAYNAASRYINVISEMLEHVINTLAI